MFYLFKLISFSFPLSKLSCTNKIVNEIHHFSSFQFSINTKADFFVCNIYLYCKHFKTLEN